MDNKNVFIIILIIIIVFFLSGDKNITTKSMNNNAFPLLLILVIFYICYNNFSMGLVFVCLILLVVSTTNIKDIIIQRLDYHTDNRFSERLNELFPYTPKTAEHLDNIDEEEQETTSVFDTTEGLDEISYDDFKQEVGQFNGDSIEQNRTPLPEQPLKEPQQQEPQQQEPRLQPQEQHHQEPLPSFNQANATPSDVNDMNSNSGRDINSMFEELNSQLNTLRSK